jgi:putative ABC transport system permease protein
MENLLQDVRYGIRMLLRGRAVTIVAVVALALGIGANTAIFSVVDSVLLSPLPYKDPDRLAMIWQTNPEIQIGFDMLPVTAADFVDWRDQGRSFQSISIIDSGRLVLSGQDAPERVAGARVSASFFGVMGVEPSLGRAFTDQEERPGANRVAVISHAMWLSRYGGDRGAIGKSLALDGSTYEIIGVMPEGFQFPRSQDLPSYFQLAPQTELWLPIGLTDEELKNRGSHNKAVIARLKPDASIEQAQDEMAAIAAKNSEMYEESRGFGASVVPLQEQLVGHTRTALWVLLAAVGFVLLIACANVANLLLARASARQKEIAIRTALGATRSRIIRQLFTESVLLSLCGGAVGILLALWGLNLLLALSPADIPRKHEIRIDGAALGFTLLISLLTGVLFGLAPSLQSSRVNFNETLKEGARGTSGATGNRLRGLLVIVEIAMTVVLLVGAGLMLRSFIGLLKTDPGFNPKSVLTMKIELPDRKYPRERDQIAFFKQVIERVRLLPGAESASAISHLPLSGTEEIDMFTIEGSTIESLSDTPLADFRFVDHNYFRAMGIPLVAGRYFTEGDNENGQRVIVINETLARRFYPGQEAVGKRIKEGDQRSDNPWSTVVGVVGDVKHSGLNSDARPTLYFPYLQKNWGLMTLVARTGSDPAKLAAAVRNEVWAVDKDQPVTDVKTLEEYASVSVSKDRFNMILLGIFAGVAMVLAAVGIYGVMSYTVAQRTHEIGIRMALGASVTDVLRLVVGRGLLLAVVGVFVGVGVALLLTGFLSSLLVGVSARDPLTFIAVPAALLAVALVASAVPAWRATKVDPMVALRYE